MRRTTKNYLHGTEACKPAPPLRPAASHRVRLRGCALSPPAHREGMPADEPSRPEPARPPLQPEQHLVYSFSGIPQGPHLYLHTHLHLQESTKSDSLRGPVEFDRGEFLPQLRQPLFPIELEPIHPSLSSHTSSTGTRCNREPATTNQVLRTKPIRLLSHSILKGKLTILNYRKGKTKAFNRLRL